MNLDPTSIALCLGGLCVVGFVGMFLLQFLGGALQIVGGLIGLVLNGLGGGPIAWCGCIVVLAIACGLLSLISYLFSVIPQCGTSQAVNLCRLLGY